MNPPLTPRARARVEAIERIQDLAWAQIAQDGAQSLSLRAIARELGLVSSALYRYFPSREALLTSLVVQAYEDLAATLQQSVQAGQPVQADDTGASTPERRWAAVCVALRQWARDEPHRFALIYGTPVPGYAAPRETIEPAARVMAQFLQVAADATGPVPPAPAPSAALTGQFRRLEEALELTVAPDRALAAVTAIGQVFGLLTLELGGQLVGTFEPADELFEATVARGAWMIGL